MFGNIITHIRIMHEPWIVFFPQCQTPSTTPSDTKHHTIMFFPQCQTPSTTPSDTKHHTIRHQAPHHQTPSTTPSDTKHHTHIKQCATFFLRFDLYILTQKTERQKILDQMVADNSRIYSAVLYVLIKICISLDINFY